MATYKLQSAHFVSAPGLVAWAINDAKFPKDRKAMIACISGTWHIPRDAAKALVLQEVKYTVEDEAVVFKFGEEK